MNPNIPEDKQPQKNNIPYENSIYNIEFFDGGSKAWKTVVNENGNYPIFKKRGVVMEIAQKMKKDQKGYIYRVSKFKKKSNGQYKLKYSIIV